MSWTNILKNIKRKCKECGKLFTSNDDEKYCLECLRDFMMEDEAHNVSEGYDEMDDV